MLTAVFWTVGISLKWITGVLEGRGRLRTLEIILEKQNSSTGNPQPNMTLRMGMTAVSRSEGHCQEQIHGNLYSEFSKRAGLSGEADKQLIRKLGFWGPQNWLLTYPAAWKGGACMQSVFIPRKQPSAGTGQADWALSRRDDISIASHSRTPDSHEKNSVTWNTCNCHGTPKSHTVLCHYWLHFKL